MSTSDLLEEWKHFKLTAEEENITTNVDAPASVDISSKIDKILVGKLFVKRPISCPVMKNTMRNAWKLENNAFEVESIGWNIFLFTFDRVLDKNRIYQTGPWSFDKSVIIIQPPPMICPSELNFTNLSIWVRFFFIFLWRVQHSRWLFDWEMPWVALKLQIVMVGAPT